MSRLKTFCGRLSLISLLFLAFGCAAASAQTFTETGDRVWREFRSKFPTPFRTVACREFDDGSRVYLLSEPPEGVSTDDIRKVFDGYVCHVWTKAAKFGYDGEIRDAVVFTDGIPSTAQGELIADLNRLMYGTDYRASYMPLPYTGDGRPFFYDRDYAVTVNDRALSEMVGTGMYRNVVTDASQSVSQLLASGQFGVFTSQTASVVLLSLPFRGDISDRGGLFHIFGCEADIVLGAILAIDPYTENGTVLIVGRKRMCDMVSMPPLRSDEILMLAKADEIGQSLNICTPGQCKVDGGYDWCPAWVSAPIIHSEYASLLTLTDIYLKFWLYQAPYDIKGHNNRRPGTSFSNPRMNDFHHIRFNWNDKDYALLTFNNEDAILHFNNIGVLNCTIFDHKTDTIISDLSTSAYSYLKNLQNAEMFRAAQYTMLMEIFRVCRISADSFSRLVRGGDDMQYLANSHKIITSLRDMSDAEIDRIVTTIFRQEIAPLVADFTEQEKIDFVSKEHHVVKTREKWDKALAIVVNEQMVKRGLSQREYMATTEYAKLKEQAEREKRSTALFVFKSDSLRLESDFCLAAIDDIEKSRSMLRALSPSDFESFCRYCASPNTYTASNYKRMRDLEKSLPAIFLLSLYARHFGFNPDALLEEYVKASAGQGGRWFRSPSVVVTNNGSTYTRIAESFHLKKRWIIGGHSLGYRIGKSEQSAVAEGKQILTLNGDALSDARHYAFKAVKAASLDDKVLYFRRSKEAMSQKTATTRESEIYRNLYSKIERAIVNVRTSHGPVPTPVEIVEQLEEVKAIANIEMAKPRQQSQKQESYRFIAEVAVREQTKLSGENADEVTDDEIRELKKRLSRLQQTLAALKSASTNLRK